MKIDRIQIVRRLLGSATQLFLDDSDPISVHFLAASALEHAEYLAEASDEESLSDHILSTYPAMNEKDLKRLRNQHYRPIKHSHGRDGNPFDLARELADFDDTRNDPILFAGWHDFMKSGAPMPIAAQVLQL